MWLYIWIVSIIIVGPLLIACQLKEESKISVLDLFLIAVLTVVSPVGLLAWMIKCGNEIILWKNK